jgi:hypothetical protein
MDKPKHSTPDDIDHLFDREIIDEEDYVEFWQQYWNRDAAGRRELVDDYIELYAGVSTELGGDVKEFPSVGLTTKDKRSAYQQAQALSELTNRDYRVARRNARGQFSKRGHFYQPIKKGGKH